MATTRPASDRSARQRRKSRASAKSDAAKSVKRPLVQNERSLLRILLDVGPRGATKSELARRSGLTPQAVGYIVDSEPWSKLVGPPGAPEMATRKRPGRPAERVALKAAVAWIIGIDYGHRTLKVGIADLWADWQARSEPIATAEVRPLEALRTAVRIATEQGTSDGRSFDDIAAVSMAIAAPVDDETGTVRSNAGADKWQDIRFRDRVREYLRRDTPVLVANDANVGALAERYWAVRRSPATIRDYADAVYLRWTTGIGAGLLIDGKLYTGTGGAAGEVGHSVVTKEEDDDWRWTPDFRLVDAVKRHCTRRCHHPCLEAVASAEAIVQDARHRLGAEGTRRPPATIAAVLAAAADGQPACEKSLSLAARYTGQMLSTVADVLNPTSIIIGGDFKNQLSLIEDDLLDVIGAAAFGPVRKDVSLISGRVEGAVIHGTIVRALESEAVVTHLIDRLAAEWEKVID